MKINSIYFKKLCLLFLMLIHFALFGQNLNSKWESFTYGLNKYDISDFIEYKNELYICGGFTDTISSNSQNFGILKWDGQNQTYIYKQFIDLGFVQAFPIKMCVDKKKDELYILMRVLAGNIETRAIVKYDGEIFTKVYQSDTPYYNISAITFYRDMLYFSKQREPTGMGKIAQVFDVYKYDINSIKPLHIYPDSSGQCFINALISTDTSIIAIGNFAYYSPPTNPLPKYKEVAYWNEKDWIGFGLNGIGSYTTCGTIFNDTIFVGGSDYLNQTDRNPNRRIHYWNDLEWVACGTANMVHISRFAKSKKNLFAVGSEIKEALNGSVTQWNGSIWLPISPLQKISTGVNCGYYYKGYLYIGGSFLHIDNDSSINSLARIKLETIGNYPIANPDVFSINQDTTFFMHVQKNDSDPNSLKIYTRIIDNPKHGIAFTKFSDSIFYKPDSAFFGADSLLYELCNEDGLCDSAFVFIKVNKKNTSTASINVLTQKINFEIYPNPSNGKLHFKIDNPGIQKINIEIYDMIGRSMHFEFLPNNQEELILNSNFPMGFYYCNLFINGVLMARQRIVIK